MTDNPAVRAVAAAVDLFLESHPWLNLAGFQPEKRDLIDEVLSALASQEVREWLSGRLCDREWLYESLQRSEWPTFADLVVDTILRALGGGE